MIGHGALAEPFAVQLPLAARRDQPVADQHLQDLIPSRTPPPSQGQAFAAPRQAVGPEAIQLQRLPQLPGQPTGTPLAWPA
jgi:hypothetical protein